MNPADLNIELPPSAAYIRERAFYESIGETVQWRPRTVAKWCQQVLFPEVKGTLQGMPMRPEMEYALDGICHQLMYNLTQARVSVTAEAEDWLEFGYRDGEVFHYVPIENILSFHRYRAIDGRSWRLGVKVGSREIFSITLGR